MPNRAPRYCAKSGCNVLVSSGYCMVHDQQRQQQKNAEYDRTRGTPAQRGYDARHRAWREVVLKRDPICKMCGVERSTVADHIKPLSQGGQHFAPSNGQGLCERCHAVKRQRESMEVRG